MPFILVPVTSVDGALDVLRRLALAQGVEHHRTGHDGREGVDDVQAGVLGRRAADGLEHADALGVDVAAGRDAHAALGDRRPGR